MLARGVCAVLALFLFFSFVSCGTDSGGSTMPDVIEKGDSAQRTLLVYMVAENSLNRFAEEDVEELLEGVAGIPRDCRLFVYVDDTSLPRLLHLYRCVNKEPGCLSLPVFDGDVCSSDTVVLGRVLDYILENYPTRDLDLVLWSHGDGWLKASKSAALQRSFGIDNGENTTVDVTEGAIDVRELAALLERLPLKVDRLMFDACFMQCIELGYALRNAVEWVIASPAEIPAKGAPYDVVAPAFFDTSGPDGIIDLYVEEYEYREAGVVLSALRTSSLGGLAEAMRGGVEKYFNVSAERDVDGVFSYLPGGDYMAENPMPSFFDVNAVMGRVLAADEYAGWRVALDAAVPYWAATRYWSSLLNDELYRFDESVGVGVSMYVPRHFAENERLNADFKWTEWYEAAGWQSAGW